MRVVGFTEPGGPEVLDVIERPVPSPGEGQLRIRVHAATVNPSDLALRSGFRATGGDDDPEVNVPGMDAAGVLEEIGDGVETDLSIGDRVMAIVLPSGSHGAYSEQIIVPAASVVRAPAGTSHAEASTLPMNGLTAQMALDSLGLESGSVIAVTGAAGILGRYVIQLARHAGLTVVADAKDDDRELVESFGADIVLPRGEGFAEQVLQHYPDGVDGVVDGALLHQAIVPAVRDAGSIVTVRGYDEPAERGVTFTPILVVAYAEKQAEFDALRQYVEDGVITLQVAETFPKEQAAQAHRRQEAGGVRGRLVVEF